MSDYALFKTTEEHEELREAVRSVAEDKIAPHAAEVDEKSTFPQHALEALAGPYFRAPHTDGAYECMGGDALATCIVFEDVARECAPSSSIPAVNKLCTMPLILGAAQGPNHRYLAKLASGEA